MKQRTDLGYLTTEAEFHPVNECPWCASSSIQHLATRGDGLEVKRCTECHIGFLASLPEDLSVFYDESYYVRSPIPGTKPAVSGYEDYDRAYTPSSFRWLTSLIAAIKPDRGTLFDFGAATGTFLDMARKEGFDVSGVELTEEGSAAAVAKGLDVKAGFFDPADWESHTFDVVTALEVLEHVTDLRATLRGLGDILREDGVLVFFVPNVTDEIIAEYGDKALDFNKSYDHTLYLNPSTLGIVCDEIFGEGSLTLFTQDVEQWGQTVSAALGVVRPTPSGNRREQTVIGVVEGFNTVEDLHTPTEATAVALMGAKFFRPELADQAIERALALGATESDLATVRAQILRNSGQIYSALGILERHILESGAEDPLAAQLLVEIVDDLTTSLGITEPGFARGIQRMHERLDSLQVLKDAVTRSRDNDTIVERSTSDVAWLDGVGRALRDLDIEARDLRYLLGGIEAERTETAEHIADLQRRFATYNQALFDIHRSRMWKLQSTFWRLKALLRGGTESEEALETDTDISTDIDELDARELPTEWQPEPQRFPVTVSVIMPVYNKGDTILTAVGSIQNQTFRDIEVVVWDDGSTDEVTQQALADISTLPNVSVTRADNQGVIGARNSAMGVARGEFLVCLDPDDTFAPTYIEKAVLYLRSHPNMAIVYPWQRTLGDKTEIWETHVLDRDQIVERNHVPVCAMFRREVFEETGGFSHEMSAGYEDWEFWAHAASLGFKGESIPEPLFEYHFSTDPTQSRDAEARAIKDELAALVKRRHEQSEVTTPPLAPTLPPPLQIAHQSTNLPKGVGTPVVLMLPWFTVGGADNVVESLVRHWRDDERTVVVFTTLGVGEGMENRLTDLLEVTPFVYELPNYLHQPLWYPFVRSVIASLDNPTILNVGSTWFHDHAGRLKLDNPDIRIIDQQFNNSGHIVGNRNARDVIDVTVVAYEALKEELDDTGRYPITTIYVGIPSKQGQQRTPHDIRKELGLAEGIKFATFVGRLSEEKRPEWLIPLADALHQHHHALVVAGNGPLGKKLRKSFNTHPAITWRKHVDDVHAVFAASAVTVLPSRIEGIPLTAMESLAMGTPVVATAVGGLPELTHVSGIHLVDPDNQEQFITTTLETIERPELQPITLPDQLSLRHMLMQYDEVVDTTPRHQSA